MKKIYTVLKLKDQFTPEIKKAAKSTEALAIKAKTSDYHAKKLGTTLKNNLAKGAKVAAAALVSVGTTTIATGTKLVKDAAKTADTIDKTSQQLGISRKAYQELEFAMSQSGVEISQFKTGMKSLLKNMDAVSEGNDTATNNFKKLGVSVLNSKGKLRGQEEVLYDTITAFQKMENSAEKSRLAQELFGKQGQEISALLNSEAGSFEKTIQKANELGLVLEDSTINAGVKLTDTLDQAKRGLAAVATRIGGELVPYAQAAGDYFIAHLPQIENLAHKVGKGFKTMGSGIKWVYDNSNILIPVLAGAASGIAAFKVISTAISLFTAFKAVVAAYTGVQTVTNATMLACPLTRIVLGITALVTAGVALYKNWEKVCDWAGKLKDKMSKLLAPLKKVKDFLGGIFGLGSTDINITAKTDDETGKPKKPGRGPRHALGTTYFAGGPTRFSEGGRQEEAVFPSGTRIIPAGKAGAGGNTTIKVSVIVQGNVIGNEAFADEIGQKTAKRIREALAV